MRQVISVNDEKKEGGSPSKQGWRPEMGGTTKAAPPLAQAEGDGGAADLLQLQGAQEAAGLLCLVLSRGGGSAA